MIKTLSFATLHFSIAFSVTWLITGDILVGGLVALIEPTINTIAFFLHEKLWLKLQANPFNLKDWFIRLFRHSHPSHTQPPIGAI